MQSVSMQLVNALQRRKDVELETIILRAPWRRIGLSTTAFLFGLLKRIPEGVRRFDPDVILFSSMVTAGVVPFLRKSVQVPLVSINHGQDVTLPLSIYQWYLPRVFNKLDGVISVSRATREASVKRGMVPEKGVALPNGFDSRYARSLPDREEALKLLKEVLGFEPEDRKILLTVGRLVKRKGHSWFIREVIPKLRTDAEYLVIGDGPEREELVMAKEQSQCGNRITLAGRQPEEVLRAAYAASDLFVMPNIPVPGDMEGFGIVLLEANQAGMPAVASNLEGIRDVIRQGVNGYRVPHEQPEEFAKKVDEVLEGDLKRFSVTARMHVEKHFSWDRVAARYLDFLREVSAHRTVSDK